MWGPSSGKLETKNIFFRSCFLNVVGATQCVSAYFAPIFWHYFMMVFILENTCRGHLVAS